MANRETFPAAPIAGDIACAPGATLVTVIGLQGIPITTERPNDQDELTYDANIAAWRPKPEGNDSISLDDVCVSDDYDFLCNGVGTEVLLNWAYGFTHQVFLDGTGVA